MHLIAESQEGKKAEIEKNAATIKELQRENERLQDQVADAQKKLVETSS
jgi:uncharacterized protein YigA (DUF484 family)